LDVTYSPGPLSGRTKMSSQSEYLIVSASLSPTSRSRALANYLADCYRTKSIAAAVVDLRDSPLPLCDGDSAYGHPSVAALTQAISDARVIIVAAPIYNFDVSAALKNLVELTGDAWEDKIVGFLCAAGGVNSYMSVMGIINSLMLDFRCLIIPRFVYATGKDFEDGQLISDAVKERIQEFATISMKIRNG
jgi:NAD(P)H-dependent FMN reductase